MRLGIIGSGDFENMERLAAILSAQQEEDEALVIVADEEDRLGQRALQWAAENGIGHEAVLTNRKVVAMSDSVLAIVSADDELAASRVGWAQSSGKPVEVVRLDQPPARKGRPAVKEEEEA